MTKAENTSHADDMDILRRKIESLPNGVIDVDPKFITVHDGSEPTSSQEDCTAENATDDIRAAINVRKAAGVKH